MASCSLKVHFEELAVMFYSAMTPLHVFWRHFCRRSIAAIIPRSCCTFPLVQIELIDDVSRTISLITSLSSEYLSHISWDYALLCSPLLNSAKILLGSSHALWPEDQFIFLQIPESQVWLKWVFVYTTVPQDPDQAARDVWWPSGYCCGCSWCGRVC